MSARTDQSPVTVRFSAPERRAAERAAKRAGRTLSEHLRVSASGADAEAMRGVLEQLRELDEMLSEGETRAARERIARLRETLG
jgi:hypothetical protein